MKVKIYNGPLGCYMSKEDEKKVCEMIDKYIEEKKENKTMEEILDILKEINIRLANLERISGVVGMLNNKAARMTDKQIEEIKNQWKIYKKKKLLL